MADIEFRPQAGASPWSAPTAAWTSCRWRRSSASAAARGEPATLLDAAEVAEIKAHTFPNGCHVAEVEVDPDTGAHRRAALHRGGRRRPRDQPDDRARPGPWRRGAGRRPGDAGAHRLRQGERPAPLRLLHGLLPAARGGPAGHRGRPDRGALRDQPARREGRGRGRRGRLAAGADQRGGGRAGGRRRAPHRHAGDAGGGVEGAARGQGGAETRRGGGGGAALPPPAARRCSMRRRTASTEEAGMAGFVARWLSDAVRIGLPLVLAWRRCRCRRWRTATPRRSCRSPRTRGATSSSERRRPGSSTAAPRHGRGGDRGAARAWSRRTRRRWRPPWSAPAPSAPPTTASRPPRRCCGR